MLYAGYSKRFWFYMKKFCTSHISYWKRTFLFYIAIVILMALPPQTWGASIAVSVDTTQNADSTLDDYNIDTNNVTFTNNADISFTTDTVDVVPASTGVTIINSVGASITATAGSNALDANVGSNNLTIDNFGTISATAGRAVRVQTSSGLSFTNNASGTISGVGNAAINLGGSDGTLINSGTISSDSQTLQAGAGGAGTVLTIVNNAGGEISSSGSTVVRLEGTDTFINRGTVKRTDTTSANAFRLDGSNNTLVLEEGSILVGRISIIAGTTGNTIQINQGFGQTYFYETTNTGAFVIQDLSGNIAVKGSAGSVGQGASESVDELLGLRSFNLRSALKRYTDYSKLYRNNELYVEPFSFYSKRGTNSTVLGYETYGGGLNLIYPLKNKKVDLILSLGHSEQDIDRDHDISRNNFLAGINARELGSLGKLKFSGFLVGGMEFHEGNREIFTNTTTTGKADVTSDYTSYELITGGQFSFDHSNIPKTTWNTELGVTFGYSFTGDYHERQFFAWGERHLVQGSVHIGEQLTTKVNKDLAVRIGAELDYRNVLMGRTQSYAVNGTLVKNKGGDTFTEKTASLRMGMFYGMSKDTIAYVNMDGRISDNATRGTYGLSAGMKLNF